MIWFWLQFNTSNWGSRPKSKKKKRKEENNHQKIVELRFRRAKYKTMIKIIIITIKIKYYLREENRVGYLGDLN